MNRILPRLLLKEPDLPPVLNMEIVAKQATGVILPQKADLKVEIDATIETETVVLVSAEEGVSAETDVVVEIDDAKTRKKTSTIRRSSKFVELLVL